MGSNRQPCCLRKAIETQMKDPSEISYETYKENTTKDNEQKGAQKMTVKYVKHWINNVKEYVITSEIEINRWRHLFSSYSFSIGVSDLKVNVYTSLSSVPPCGEALLVSGGQLVLWCFYPEEVGGPVWAGSAVCVITGCTNNSPVGWNGSITTRSWHAFCSHMYGSLWGETQTSGLFLLQITVRVRFN